ncbi:DUF3826 domain-containing protein [Sphingobacterium corticibacterium]|uniref:DUF3826 domain-containing protein n=1 Tax=Sphingobacterium corticibacterium TaxID=2484746 RepID=A0A4Q6XIQ0_9SPHI|nr:DUF3826 domain-containing protein [Sphingobacterium corticibacterium]RZF59900.1 DUF3826 domain-containing protein [Sphingobacterium corticibacterium]
MKIKIKWFACVLFSLFAMHTNAQGDQDAYIEVITKRSDKIIATLGIEDSSDYSRILGLLVDQYAIINAHHEERELNIRKLKDRYSDQKEKLAKKRTKYEAQADKKLRKMHHVFINELQDLLNHKQLEGIKDGMTYGVLPLTYRAYQDMIPSLTPEQKSIILTNLTEARELAMDEPGSREKHGVFGKYKGRINNYLSSEGYDLQSERFRWEQRQAEAKTGGAK